MPNPSRIVFAAVLIGAVAGCPSEDEEPVGWQEDLALGPEHGLLMSVAGSSPSRVFTVGGQGAADGTSTGIAFTSDGESWDPLELPAGVPQLNWVFTIDDDVWAVGHEGVAVRGDGTSFAVVDTPTDTILWGIWGAAADDLWAVGGNGIDDDPVLLHFDGAAWSLQTLPAFDSDVFGLFKVWGRSASDVYAVGDLGAMIHYDGSAWTPYTNDSAADLISLWGTDDGIIAVGGRSNARVARPDGTAVVGMTHAFPGLSGVWADATGRATVVGSLGVVGEVAPGSLDIELAESGTPLFLHAVFGFDDGPRYAVGGNLLDPPPHVGVILRNDG